MFIDGTADQSFAAKLGRFADHWWPVLVITVGAAFIFGVPFKITK